MIDVQRTRLMHMGTIPNTSTRAAIDLLRPESANTRSVEKTECTSIRLEKVNDLNKVQHTCVHDVV